MSDITSPVSAPTDGAPDGEAESAPDGEAESAPELGETANTGTTIALLPAAVTFASWERAVYSEVYNNLWLEARSMDGQQQGRIQDL